jgi:hypothetical protein
MSHHLGRHVREHTTAHVNGARTYIIERQKSACQDPIK